MIYASREATRVAVRKALEKPIVKHTTPSKDSLRTLNTSCEWDLVPMKNEKAGIYAKAFKNANGAELIYKK